MVLKTSFPQKEEQVRYSMKIRTANDYFRETFGCKVMKVSVDAGFTCPNRDGTLGNRGCIFCSAGGSGDFAGDRRQSVTEQFNNEKKNIEAKLPKKEDYKYLIYFQAFTNTYAPVEILRDKFTEAIGIPEAAGISIATRPDCIDKEKVSLLKELNMIKPVIVELGLQTIHEKTAGYIRRGYTLDIFENAMELFKGSGIHVIVHVILGLPRETREDMLETVSYVGKSGAEGIKLQLLHVLKDTDLCDEYMKGTFETLTEDEYVSLVTDCIKELPRNMVIHRLTGDGDKRKLVSPLWSGNKKHVLNRINKAISEM